MKLLICDLDETLIHTSETELAYPADLCFDGLFVYYRPHLLEFLEAVSRDFDIGIWSSGSDDYVRIITERIFNGNKGPVFTYGRSKCLRRRDIETGALIFEKRIKKLKSLGYRKEEILMIDDSWEKLRANYGNAIYVNEYLGGKDDDELLDLYQYLHSIKDYANFRELEKRKWRLTPSVLEHKASC
jgi:carboxy-terminal domain RNA polymerase II polypeptide A small phosphatase